MLDTIHIVIDNPLVDRETRAYRYSEFIEYVTKKATDRSSKFSYKEQFSPGVSLTVVNGTWYDDTGTLYFHKDNMRVPSSSSELIFAVNYAKERIEINVSVPKFEAGNNVFYLLDDADFGDFLRNFKAVYRMIKKYIKKILLDLGGHNLHLAVKPEHVSLERIDLCYNVLCKDQDEVRRRILAAAQLLKRRQTDATVTELKKDALYGDETFAIGSSLGWYFKVYNKHVEFKKHDYKRILKHYPDEKLYNATTDKMYTGKIGKANFILENSKRIVRYEMGFRSSYFDHLFWNGYTDQRTGEHKDLAWKDSPDKKHYLRYKQWRHNPPPINDVTEHADGTKTVDSNKDYSTFKYVRQMFLPQTFKAMRFHLGDNDKDELFYNNEFDFARGFKWTPLNFEKSFDIYIMRAVFHKFYEMLTAYNPDFKDVHKELKNYKSQSARDYDILKYLKKGKSLDECVQKFRISRQTIHNVQKRFAKQGVQITRKTIHQLQDEYRPISLMPYFHFKPINNLMMVKLPQEEKAGKIVPHNSRKAG